ncbi:isoprenyl transferase [Oceanobacillus rekensis]|uniref:isoprenyl transferase n=1 Tax=Oceanobacillus rekensis TaxID=937927 RepID=UPI000B438D4B|nr:isoprenyl transferase [Oceanobacillus rekensis]
MSMKIPFFNNKQSVESMHYPEENTPEHIAIIMDGTGRWAEKRGMSRVYGHKEGVTTVINIVKAAVKFNVKVLTLYAFSTENWKRPNSEIEYIMGLPKKFLNMYLADLISNNVRIKVIGDMDHLPSSTRETVQYAIDRTENNEGLQLNFALNYGGKQEILNAMKEAIADINDAKLSLDQLDKQQFSRYLYTSGMTDPDLLIRTGGEKRLNNFLLWQLAYSEFWFTDVLWPDFSEREFIKALEEYKQRKRRFGGV